MLVPPEGAPGLLGERIAAGRAAVDRPAADGAHRLARPGADRPRAVVAGRRGGAAAARRPRALSRRALARPRALAALLGCSTNRFRHAIIDRVAELTRRKLLAGWHRRHRRRGAPAQHRPPQPSVGGAGGRAARRPPHGRPRARRLPRRPDGRPRGQRLRPARDPARLRLGQDDADGQRPRAARVGALRGRQGDRGRPGREVRGLDLQPAHPRADAALPRGRAPADHVRQRLRTTRTRSTSTASTRPRWTACPGIGAGQIEPGGKTVYEFDALPAGLHLYHCHVRPLAEHIAKGLYGAFIVDPADGREDAEELVMVMNGFDTNFDRANEMYAANSIPFAYMNKPIQVARDDAGADLPRQRARVRPDQLVPPAREPVPLLPHGHVEDPVRVHRHGDALPGPARDPRVEVRPSRARSCSTRTSPSSPSSAGRASSRSRDGGPRRHRGRAARRSRRGCSGSSRWC